MAVTVTGLNYTQFSSCDSGSAGGTWGGSPTADTDNYKEGSASISDALKASGNNDWTFTPTSSVDLSGAKHLRIWILATQGSLINLEANGGIQIGITDGSNTGWYYIGGRDTYPGGWRNFVVDVSRTVDAGTKPTSMNAITVITIRINLTGTSKNVDNTWVDNLCVCDGLVAYGDDVGGYFDMEDIFAVDDDPASGGWGVITKFGGVFYVVGELQIGDASGTSGCKFNAKNQIVIFEDRSIGANENINAALMGFNVVDNGTGTTEFILGEKSGTQGISGCVITVQDTAQGSKYYIDGATDTDVDNFKLYGSNIYEATAVDMPLTAANVEVLGSNFIGCGKIDVSTAIVQYCNFISADGDAIELPGTTFNVLDCQFIDATDHAIEISVVGDYNFDNLKFSGNTYDVENTTAGAVTVNNLNGSDASTYENTGAGSTTINTAVYITVYAKDISGSVIQTAQTAVYKSSDDAELMNEDTDVNGKAENTFNYISNTDVYIRVRKSSPGDTRYYPVDTAGTITENGLMTTVVMIEDPYAV